MKFLYEYWFCIYLRTRANTHADIVPVTLSALFRPQKTYFLLSEGSKSLIITFFLFPALNSITNITMLKKLPDHFNPTQGFSSIYDLIGPSINISNIHPMKVRFYENSGF